MTSRRDKQKAQRAQLNKQLEPTEVKPKEKDEAMIQLGKFFFNLAQLVFGGVILTNIFEMEYGTSDKIFVASIAILLFVVLGWILIKRGNILK